LDHLGFKRYGSRYGEDAARSATLPIHLEIQSWKQPEGLQFNWKDEKAMKIERQLTEIVVTMIVAGEMQYRLGEVARRKRLIERKAHLIEKAKREAEEERLRLEGERRQREQAKIDHLLVEAASL